MRIFNILFISDLTTKKRESQAFFSLFLLSSIYPFFILEYTNKKQYKSSTFLLTDYFLTNRKKHKKKLDLYTKNVVNYTSIYFRIYNRRRYPIYWIYDKKTTKSSLFFPTPRLLRLRLNNTQNLAKKYTSLVNVSYKGFNPSFLTSMTKRHKAWISHPIV